ITGNGNVATDKKKERNSFQTTREFTPKDHQSRNGRKKESERGDSSRDKLSWVVSQSLINPPIDLYSCSCTRAKRGNSEFSRSPVARVQRILLTGLCTTSFKGVAKAA